MFNYHYKIISNHLENDEPKTNFAITHKMSRFRLKRYLRTLLMYKHPNHKLIVIYVFRCDENGVVLGKQRPQFIQSYKDLR